MSIGENDRVLLLLAYLPEIIYVAPGLLQLLTLCLAEQKRSSSET